jgi:hypothetical protein
MVMKKKVIKKVAKKVAKKIVEKKTGESYKSKSAMKKHEGSEGKAMMMKEKFMKGKK